LDLARFEQEARAAAALNHPHIAVVHDIGTENGTDFMVQEYLEGDTLREPLQKGALPLKKALGLATEIAEALAAAHAAGIIHRDLKPENIFVGTDETLATALGTRLNVVLNWFEELNRLVPTDAS
jgi:serine/threonine protein kinase